MTGIPAGAAKRVTRPGTLGRLQLARRLDWELFQVKRAIRLGLIPEPDVVDRWSAGLVAQFVPHADSIVAKVGSVPDMGASRCAAFLSARFGFDVSLDAVFELYRTQRLGVVGNYRGNALYDGRDLDSITEPVTVRTAIETGRCLTADEAAQHLRVRRSDFDHLVRAGLVAEVRRVYGSHRRVGRAAPMVALYRVADLDGLAQNPAIDWPTVRATPPGRRSPLAALPTGLAGKGGGSR